MGMNVSDSIFLATAYEGEWPRCWFEKQKDCYHYAT